MSRAAALALSLVLAGAGCVDLVHHDAANPDDVERVLAANDPPGRLDVAIALGCPADDDTGEASPCERCRVKSALRAYRDGDVGAIIMTGGPAHNRFVEAEAMGRLAERRGLPPSQLALEPRALTTWQNLRFSQRIMRERGWTTALIVSTYDHLPRAKRFADWFGIRARYRACDRDLPEDSDAEWRGGITPRAN